jgi:hypothetical protein
MLDYQDILDLAGILGCPPSDLLALSTHNDPFYAGRNSRRLQAEWFAELCNKLGLGSGLHVRRAHYRASINPPVPILKLDGTAYQNTENDFRLMVRASRDARYLELVPAEWFVDRRNDDPIINAEVAPSWFAPSIGIEHAEGFDSSIYWLPDEPELPALSLDNFTAEQRYLVEIWIEKTTVHDVLEPLARRYGVNLITFKGEGSETACRAAIDRASRAKKPLRIAYISDFDPGGRSMPVAIARKIEFWLKAKDSDLDVTLDPIMLLPEQVEQYDLPRSPIKESERRAAKFEQSFGEGAVELDALEALHPGELRRIAEQAVLRYIDPDLKDRQEKDANAIEAGLREIEERVYQDFEPEIAKVKERYGAICKSLKDLQKDSTDLWGQITATLEAEAPHVDESDIPEAPEADQEAPLFDSKRHELTQLDWYRHWQRRESGGRAMTAPRMVKLANLWQRRSAKGTVYFSGFMGPVQVLLFKEGRKPHPTRPDEEVIVWKLLVQERDPARRPQQRRDQPSRGQSSWDASRDRDPEQAVEVFAPPREPDPGQHDTGDQGRPFDDEIPF